MRKALLLAIVVVLLCFAPANSAAIPLGETVVAVTAQIAMFPTEGAAQAHCPADVVVWLNTKSGIFHEKGMRWYGRTKQGAYVCRKEAIAGGFRDTRNGQ